MSGGDYTLSSTIPLEYPSEIVLARSSVTNWLEQRKVHDSDEVSTDQAQCGSRVVSLYIFTTGDAVEFMKDEFIPRFLVSTKSGYSIRRNLLSLPTSKRLRISLPLTGLVF